MYTIEFCFRHWIKNKKGNCDFFILTFFSQLRLFILQFWLFYSQLQVMKSEMQDINSDKKKKKKVNSDFFHRIASLHLRILWWIESSKEKNVIEI